MLYLHTDVNEPVNDPSDKISPIILSGSSCQCKQLYTCFTANIQNNIGPTTRK